MDASQKSFQWRLVGLSSSSSAKLVRLLLLQYPFRSYDDLKQASRLTYRLQKQQNIVRFSNAIYSSKNHTYYLYRSISDFDLPEEVEWSKYDP